MICKNAASIRRQCLGLATWPILKSLKINLWHKRGGCEKIAWLFTNRVQTRDAWSFMMITSFRFGCAFAAWATWCPLHHCMVLIHIVFAITSFHQFLRNQWQCSYRMLHTHCVRWRILSLNPSDGQTQSFGTFYEAMSLCRPGTTWLKTQWWCVPRELPKSVRVQGAWHGWWNWSPSAGIGDLNRLWLLLKNLLWMFWLLRHRESTRSTWLKDTSSLLHHTEAIIPCRNLLLLFALHRTTCNRGWDSFHSWGSASKWYLEAGAIPDPKPK